MVHFFRMKSIEPKASGGNMEAIPGSMNSMLAEFGVQTGNTSFNAFAKPRAGLDFKLSSKDWITAQATPPNR